MKKRIRLIPFLISLLIVVGSVTGIFLYSYYKYPGNKIKFLSDYFHDDDYEKQSTTNLIDNAVKWNNQYYQFNPSKLSYRDPETKQIIGESPNSNINGTNLVGAYFKNGIMHIPGYFDIAIYASTNYDEFTEEWKVVYSFYIFNVVYKGKSFNLPKKYYLAFVDGVGEGTPGSEEEGIEVYPTGDIALDELKKEIRESGIGGSTVNAPYTYSYKHNDSDLGVYGIYDVNADNPENEDALNWVHYFNPGGDYFGNIDFSELKNTTFFIYEHIGKDGDYEDTNVIIEGTLENLLTSKELIDSPLTLKGYNTDFYNGSYFKSIWPRLLLHSSITLLVSGFIAVMFYLIWQTSDDDQNLKNKSSKKKVVQKPKVNKKKPT